jgi:hypothetical protein
VLPSIPGNEKEPIIRTITSPINNLASPSSANGNKSISQTVFNQSQTQQSIQVSKSPNIHPQYNQPPNNARFDPSAAKPQFESHPSDPQPANIQKGRNLIEAEKFLEALNGNQRV